MGIFNVGPLPTYGVDRRSAGIREELTNDPTPYPVSNPSNFFGAQWQNLGPSGQGAAMLGGAAGLLSMFGRKQGPSRYEVEQEGLARSGMGNANAYAGQLGGIGQMLQNRGLADQDMYRSRYMDTLTNPANMQYDMAALAAQDSARQRGISSRFGMMGGNLGASRAMASAYNPGFASGVAGLMGQRRQGLASAYGYGANAAGNDFSQGSGMLNNSFNVAQGGRQNMMGVLGRLQASADARRAASDQAMMGAVKGIGSLAGGGFG
jgi:hypothetical protein